MRGSTDADGGDGGAGAWATVAVAVLTVVAGGFVLAGAGPAPAGGLAAGGAPGGQEATPAPLPAGERLNGTRSLADSDVVVRGNGTDEVGYAAAAGDVNGDGTPDVVLGAPLHNGTAPQSGAVFVFFGPVAPGNLTVGDADVALLGESGVDWAGNSVAVADVDGDGVGDLVVGAPRNDAAGDDAGAVYVVHGGPDLNGTVPLRAADATLAGAVVDSLAGYSVAAANVTGDGTADVVVGAPRGDASPGRSYVVDGARLGPNTSLADADATLVGEAPGDEAGWRVAVAGNATGEGPAVVVGAPMNDAAGENAGAAYVVAAPFDGEVALGDAAAVRRGPAAGALAGWSVAGAGDVDGDGRPEVLVGAPQAGRGGAASVVDAEADRQSLSNATALRGQPGDLAGWVVAGTGDVTCDGRPDVVVGAPGNDTGGSDAGVAYVAAVDGDRDRSDASADPTNASADPTNASADLSDASAILVGANGGDRVGRADAIGTVPGENATGLVVGAPFGDAPQTAHVVYAACPG